MGNIQGKQKRNPQTAISSITIYQYGLHGLDYPNIPLQKDTNIRILSLTGEMLCYGFNLEPKIGMVQWMKDRVTEYEQTLEKSTDEFVSYKLLQYIQKIYIENFPKKFDVIKDAKESDSRDILASKKNSVTQKNIDKGKNTKIFTPVFDHDYSFENTPKDSGFYIMDMRNENSKCSIKIGDNICSKEKSIIKQISNPVTNDSIEYRPGMNINLSSIILFLKTCGFDIINIIDGSCRTVNNEMSKNDIAQITELENNSLLEIDKSKGGNKIVKTNRKYIKRNRFKRIKKYTKRKITNIDL
jgi:hypothetical protein